MVSLYCRQVKWHFFPELPKYIRQKQIFGDFQTHKSEVEPMDIKLLWDEWRISKQVSEGMWWLVSEPDPPVWFIQRELGLKTWY